MSEDVQLRVSYCRQSPNPISGNKQSVDKLWDKVYNDFLSNWVVCDDKILTSLKPRTQSTLTTRWNMLKPNLIKWGS